MDKTKQKIFFGVVFIFLIALQFWGGPGPTDTGKNNFRTFNESSIDGNLTYFGYKNHGAAFKVHNSKETFVFHVHHARKGNKRYLFNNVAELGDHIVKPQYADTLYLIKKGNQVYRFFFVKLDY
jgi:hypothetical protein